MLWLDTKNARSQNETGNIYKFRLFVNETSAEAHQLDAFRDAGCLVRELNANFLFKTLAAAEFPKL